MLDDEINAEVRRIGELTPVVKARVVGFEGGQESNVREVEDAVEGLFGEAGAIGTPFPPETLCILFEHSSSLRQNIDAYATNIDAFGHRFEPVIDFEADDADEQIANAILLERPGLSATDADIQMPSEEEVAKRKAEVMRLMRVELSRLKIFFDFCCDDESFVSLRRRTRQDLEILGNAYWEVLRNRAGEIDRFVYVPGFTIRLLPLEKGFVEVDRHVKVSDLKYATRTVKKRFRKLVQIVENVELIVVYFKEFGDPRIVSRATGNVYESVEDLKAADPHDAPATELLHFKIDNPRSSYGVPRWIGNLLAVLGTRQAEEVNYLYFENKSVPPLAVLVSGGRLSSESIPRLEKFVEENIKGKKNFHKILILEAEPPGEAKDTLHTGRLRIELKPLTAAQLTDAMFMKYDERNFDKVGQSFRLPRMLRGDIRDFNRSTAQAALMFAEMQVFQPEREDFDFIIDRKILTEIGIVFWHFRSNAPVNRDPVTMAEIVRNLANANAITPNDARALLEDIFNRVFPRIKAAWANQPIAITQAGVMAEKQDLTTADLEQAGILQPAQDGRRRRRDEDLCEEAARLIRIRSQLVKAEADAAERAFDGGEDIEILLPADEMAALFENHD